MWHFLYLFSLILSICGLLFIDVHYKIAIGKDKNATLKTLGCAVLLFLVWDMAAIALGVFKHGSSSYALPFTILPELPIEEILFLTLLCYCVLLVYLEVPKWRRMQ